MVKYIKQLTIPYWKGKKIDVDLYWRCLDSNNQLCLTIWKCKKMIDVEGYEHVWGTNWWKHIMLWKRL